MKKLAVLLFIGCISLSINAQEETTATKVDPNAPKFKFATKNVDYGSIEKNADGVRLLKFTNVGKSPLIISRVTGSCGCTVPSTPKEPIMPGQTGEIAVKYDTNRVGQIAKSITITSNADRPKIVIPVRGNVKKESSLTKLENHEKSMVATPEQ
ncbi:DUF1573 domain-containing protein [Aureibaculum sp. A20]|uniref:DUF1573 domain-containing protein n=1 Tax=Aureibaculum flavum TaxID=2795986 RepID=A0ABS0WUV5_9FLAO|nr:DUF1573 domain-containing protein [Aureibaculum flavum]MBJ2175766.1 DUF1573 domain-containing protein [Aureibaculum flavum]